MGLAGKFDRFQAVRIGKLAILQDPSAAIENRRSALGGLAGRKRPELRQQLLELLDDASLRRDAIRAMAVFDDENLARTLIRRYGDFREEDKQDVVQTLASRPRYRAST